MEGSGKLFSKHGKSTHVLTQSEQFQQLSQQAYGSSVTMRPQRLVPSDQQSGGGGGEDRDVERNGRTERTERASGGRGGLRAPTNEGGRRASAHVLTQHELFQQLSQQAYGDSVTMRPQRLVPSNQQSGGGGANVDGGSREINETVGSVGERSRGGGVRRPTSSSTVNSAAYNLEGTEEILPAYDRTLDPPRYSYLMRNNLDFGLRGTNSIPDSPPDERDMVEEEDLDSRDT